MSSQLLSRDDYQKAVGFTFDYFDKSKRGYLERDNFRDVMGAISGKLGNMPITDELINNVFKRLDLNNNGKVTAANMHQVLQKYYYQ